MTTDPKAAQNPEAGTPETRPDQQEAPHATESAPADKEPSLEDQLAATKQEADQFRDKFLRAHAEMENLRRRHTREREETAKFACESLLKGLIPVLDCFDKACAPQTGVDSGSKSYLEGVEMVHKQLLQVLAKHGLEPVRAAGAPFDPNVHQAVMRVESDVDTETVKDEFARGYVLFGRLLRPAMVSVVVPAAPSGKAPDVGQESQTGPE